MEKPRILELYLLPFLVILISTSINAQSKWSFGVSFIPIQTSYTFGSQKYNFIMLSGIEGKREVSEKVSLSAGVYYWRNEVFSDSSTYWKLRDQNFGGYQTYSGRYLQLYFGIDYFINQKLKWHHPIFIRVGLSQILGLNTQYYSTINGRKFELYLDEYEKGPEGTLLHLSVGVQKDLGKNVYLELYPVYMKAIDSYFDDRYSLFSYNEAFGIGVSVKKYL